MNKMKQYKIEVLSFLESNDYEGLEHYILEKSNLPGRMANLTLISVIADSFKENISFSKSWYSRIQKWVDLKTDGNDSETELVLVALESFGEMYICLDKNQKIEITQQLHSALNDKRWRVREIVTESYKRIGIHSYGLLQDEFNSILNEPLTPLEVRGILATVAHPELLKSSQQLNFSQKILEQSFNYYLAFNNEKFTKEDKLILKKGLSFAPSVIINKNPDEGFLFFNTLVLKDDKDVMRIVKENLKKKRLSSIYPTEVDDLLKIINKKR